MELYLKEVLYSNNNFPCDLQALMFADLKVIES